MNLDTLYLTSVALLTVYDVAGIIVIVWTLLAIRKLLKERS